MTDTVASRSRVRHGAPPPHAPPPDLARALAACRKAARRGYDLAKRNLDAVSTAMSSARRALSSARKELEEADVRTPEVLQQIEDQLKHIAAEIAELHTNSERQLETYRERLDKFSVTLFGRTMAGKSTLMEILTRGDGTTIGKGAQRTTRDVRAYPWNGLEVTDVPGVAAFEGAADEEVAFESARQADLILFLITDDAPQPVEAEHLARVRRLGKPVLGICNVKVAVKTPEDLEIFLDDPAKPFDNTRLTELIRQFHEFADVHGSRIPFVHVHLASRFLAGRPEHGHRARELIAASRFEAVERRIISEVIGRGRFLRVKSFIDTAAAPLLELAWRLLEFGAQNSSGGRVLIAKRKELAEWAETFRERSIDSIRTKVDQKVEKLREAIPEFVDEHWDDEDLSGEWRHEVEAVRLDAAVAKLQERIAEESHARLSELARELKTELKLVGKFNAEDRVRGESVFDSKRAWNWGVTIASSGLTIAAIVLASGPLGWAAAAVGTLGFLVSWLFEDGEKKRRRAKERISSRLERHVADIERDTRAKLMKWFHEDVLDGQIRCVQNDMSGVISAVFTLADTQRKLAWKLVEEAAVLHQQLLTEALSEVGAKSDLKFIKSVARVPGVAVMLLVDPGYRMPPQTKDRLERLLGERIWFAVDTQNRASILRQAIGRAADAHKVSIEDSIQVAHVGDLGRDQETLDRVRLAQQLTRLHVMS